MHTSFLLTIANEITNQTWTTTELKQLTVNEEFKEDYSRQTLMFCKAWLDGQEEFLLHTSGSTGKPKPILLTRHQLQTSATLTAQKLQLFEGTTALVCLSTQYIAGLMMLVRGLVNGWHLTVIAPTQLPFATFDTSFDFVALVPAQLQQTFALQPEKIALLNQMKAILVGGAAVSESLAATIRNRLTAPVYSTYGMTETVSHIALQRLNDNLQNTANQYFSLLPTTQINTDERGCLRIQSSLTQGEWLQTNDVVSLVYEAANSQQPIGFRWLGRADNVINSGGVKIQIEEVEQKIERILLHFSLTPRIAITSSTHEIWGEQVILAIEGRNWEQTLLEKLQTALAQSLKKYEIPKKIVFLALFPETPTAKINRSLLKEQVSKM